MEPEPQTAPPTAGPAGDDRSADTASRRLRHRLLVIAKLAVSAALLWLLFAAYDVSEAARRIAGIRPGFLALAAAMEVLSMVLATWRWWLILRAMNIRLAFRSAFPLVWIGLFFNQALPSNLGGDVLRVWRVFKRGTDPFYAFGSVMLDRVVALIGMVVLVAACLPFVSSLSDDPLLVWTLAGIIGVTLAGLAVLIAFDRILPLTRRMLPEQTVQRLHYLSTDIRQFLLGLSTSVPTVAVSVVNHVMIVAMMFALARGLGIAVGFGEALVLFPPVLLFSLMPVSYAGWGVREGAMVAALGFVGVASAEAIALSLTFGASLLVISLPGGVMWFVTGNRGRS